MFKATWPKAIQSKLNDKLAESQSPSVPHFPQSVSGVHPDFQTPQLGGLITLPCHVSLWMFLIEGKTTLHLDGILQG